MRCARSESADTLIPIARNIPEGVRFTAAAGTVSDSRKRDHAPDAVLCLHQLEAAVYLVEGQSVAEERLDVDLAGEPAFDELRHL